MTYFIYDLETLINCFTFSGKFRGDPKIHTFEISSRKNERTQLLSFLSYLQNSKCHMVGFNNLGFDYLFIHELLNNPYTFDYTKAYQLCQTIIGSQQYGGAYNQISLGERIIPQIDLVKINHFDNKSKRTPLKSLQFAMRLDSVEDMPVKMGVDLTEQEMTDLISYNHHDVTSTEAFLERCIHLIELRKELLDTGTLSGDVLNFSDVKIGTEYLIKKLGRAKCFRANKPIQTFRDSVNFKEIILPKISYRNEEFEAVLDWFKGQIIYTASEDESPKLEAKLAGLEFFFGVGGAHASVENRKYVSNDTHVIKDIDVASMYPSIAIANGFYPEHLGQDFKQSYAQLVRDRKQYKKTETMNAVLKLASNGAFGNGDNPYSPFYDPRFPKQITVNGQLQILQLVEVLSLIPGVQVIQANTDGVTIYMPRAMEAFFQLWKADWEAQTLLKLEEVEYAKLWQSDVNNFLAVKYNGEIKAKGRYWWPKEPKDYDGQWSKDFSSMVVQKVTEQVLINGWKPEDLIKLASDPFDFMLRYKTTAGSKVYIGDKEMPKTVRYYVSTAGQPMKKISEPKGEDGQYKRKNKLTDSYFNKIMSEIGRNIWDDRIHTGNKSKYEERSTNIENGRLVKCCNLASDFNWNDVDWDYYIQEIGKLNVFTN